MYFFHLHNGMQYNTLAFNKKNIYMNSKIRSTGIQQKKLVNIIFDSYELRIKH